MANENKVDPNPPRPHAVLKDDQRVDPNPPQPHAVVASTQTWFQKLKAWFKKLIG